MLFRWLRAKIGGYFWLPCPRCGRKFGGYEKGGHLALTATRGEVTCKKCPGEYVEINGAIYEPVPVLRYEDTFPKVIWRLA